MSESRRYNLRSRKPVNYKEDLPYKAPANKPVTTPRSQPKQKKLSSQTKPGTSRTKKGKQQKDQDRKLEDESYHSMNDDFSRKKSRLNQNNDFDLSSGEDSDYKTLPSDNVELKGVRKRLLAENSSYDTNDPGNTSYYQSVMQNQQNQELDENEGFSGEDEPDSTIPDFGLSPIKHEESIAFTEGERRDEFRSYATRDPRPVLKRHKSKEDVMKEFQASVKWQILWSVLFLVIISTLAVAVVLKYDDVRMRTTSSRKSRLERHMEKLKVQFPSQTFRFWNVLGGASLGHVHHPSNLERPIVVLLAGTTESALTMRCLANKVAAMFDDMFQTSVSPMYIKGTSFVQMNSDEAKIRIDKKLKTGFAAGGRTAVVHNIDNIPPCSILLFHSFCENENAPYKDAAFILTLQLGADDVDLDDLKPRAIDALVSDHLKTRWDGCPEDLPPDKQDALLSRVANNIARVKAEDEIDLKKINCPLS